MGKEDEGLGVILSAWGSSLLSSLKLTLAVSVGEQMVGQDGSWWEGEVRGPAKAEFAGQGSERLEKGWRGLDDS